MAAVAEEPQTTSNGAAVAEKAQQPAAPVMEPLATPAPESRPKEPAALTPDQAAKYDWLLQKVRGWDSIAHPKHASHAGPLTDGERRWLTRECLLRYLRATKWKEHEAEKRLVETLLWRREYGVEGLAPEHISPENETGKQVIVGYDKQGRPCQYLNPGRQNTSVSPRQVQHLVFMVERVVELMPPGQETLALLINFKTSKNRSNTAPGIGQGKEVLGILQNHYPERLGKALIINVPWIVWGFFKLITPFIDPLTREKLKFNEDMTQYVPAEQLWTEFAGGQLNFEYDHSVYWPALMKLCTERREEQMRRWEAGGKLIGEHEDYLKGATEVGAGEGALKADPAVPEAQKVEESKTETAAAPDAAAEVPRVNEAQAEASGAGELPTNKEAESGLEVEKVEPPAVQASA